MKKTKTLMLLLSILCYRSAFAQDGSTLVFEGSQVFSSFRFKDTQGKIDNTFALKIGGAFNLGYQYVFENGLIVGGDIGLSSAGATKVYTNTNCSWNLQYEKFKLNAGYIIGDNCWAAKPYVMVSPYYGYLLKATQTTGSEDYDLKKGTQFSLSEFGIATTGGVRIGLWDGVQTFAAYNHNFGLLNIENTPGQRLYNRGFSLSLGLTVNVKGKLNNSCKKQ